MNTIISDKNIIVKILLTIERIGAILWLWDKDIPGAKCLPKERGNNMAKYEVKHSCGHVETVELYGKIKDRERKIEWMETQICDDCARKQLTEKWTEKAKKLFVVDELPALIGTPKQIAWAERLRLTLLRELFTAYETDNTEGAAICDSDAFRSMSNAIRDIAPAEAKTRKITDMAAIIEHFKAALIATLADAVTTVDSRFFIDNREKNYTLAAYFCHVYFNISLDDLRKASKLVHVNEAIERVKRVPTKEEQPREMIPVEENETLNEVITTREAVELYGVTPGTVRRWCLGQKGLPPRLPAGSYRKSGATWLMLKKYTDQIAKEDPYRKK